MSRSLTLNRIRAGSGFLIQPPPRCALGRWDLNPGPPIQGSGTPHGGFTTRPDAVSKFPCSSCWVVSFDWPRLTHAAVRAVPLGRALWPCEVLGSLPQPRGQASPLPPAAPLFRPGEEEVRADTLGRGGAAQALLAGPPPQPRRQAQQQGLWRAGV